MHCIVVGCLHNNKKGHKNFFAGSFFALPKDTTLRKAWLNKIGRVDPQWTAKHGRKGEMGSGKNDRVCSAHFVDDDYTMHPELARKAGYKTISLKADAVPSQNMGRREDDTPTNPSKRLRMAVVKRQNLKVYLFLLSQHNQVLRILPFLLQLYNPRQLMF